MTTFLQLFQMFTPTRPGVDFTDTRELLFPDLILQSRKLHLWNPGDLTSHIGPRLLIGVAVWSRHDMELLDAIESSIHLPMRFDVFSVGACQTPADVRRYISNVELGQPTPMVEFWNDCVLVDYQTGHDARTLVLKMCQVNNFSGARSVISGS